MFGMLVSVRRDSGKRVDAHLHTGPYFALKASIASWIPRVSIMPTSMNASTDRAGGPGVSTSPSVKSTSPLPPPAPFFPSPRLSVTRLKGQDAVPFKVEDAMAERFALGNGC
jgi:hypothetical protein